MKKIKYIKNNKFKLLFSINKKIWEFKLFKLTKLKKLLLLKTNPKLLWLKKLKTLFKVNVEFW